MLMLLSCARWTNSGKIVKLSFARLVIYKMGIHSYLILAVDVGAVGRQSRFIEGVQRTHNVLTGLCQQFHGQRPATCDNG